MNKRQKKKRLEREKKEVIKGIDYIDGVFTKAAKEMREHLETMPDSMEKIFNHFFVEGFKFSLTQLVVAKHLVEKIK